MENDREVRRLVNVLDGIARAAHYASWRGRDPEAVKFCVGQYNRVLARLTELEPSIARLFAPLAEGASPEVVRMVARELAAYFEEEETPARERGGRRHFGGCGRRRARMFVWSPMFGMRGCGR